LAPATREPATSDSSRAGDSPFESSGPPPQLPGVPLDEEPGQHVPGSFLGVLPQFFVFPLILVATLTAAWLGLRLLMGGTPDDVRAVLDDIHLAAGPHGRWQAMHTLADGLRRGSLALDEVPAAELAALWTRYAGPQGDTAEAREQTARTRHYLLQVFAWKRAPELAAIAQEALADEDRSVRLAGLSALAQMRDAAALPALAGVLDAGDDGERFLALGALARLAVDGSAPAADAVAGALVSGSGLLARNAVLALADAGDPRAAPGLPALLSRAGYDLDPSLDGPDAALQDAASRANGRANVVEGFLVQACRAASKSPDPALAPLLRALAADDPSLKVRSAAINALHDRGESTENP